MIIDNIDKKLYTKTEGMNSILNEEYSERLFKNHNINIVINKNLRKVKSPI